MTAGALFVRDTPAITNQVVSTKDNQHYTVGWCPGSDDVRKRKIMERPLLVVYGLSIIFGFKGKLWRDVVFVLMIIRVTASVGIRGWTISLVHNVGSEGIGFCISCTLEMTVLSLGTIGNLFLVFESLLPLLVNKGLPVCVYTQCFLL